MHAFFGCLLAMSLAQPVNDPRAIDPAANRPEIVIPGGPTLVQTPKTTPPEPRRTAEPATAAKTKPEPEPERTRERKRRAKATPDEDELADASGKCFPAHGRCRRLNVAGISIASVGAGMLGAGVGFMLAPEFPIPDEPVSNRSLRPPGVALLAVGAVTVVSGAMLILVGHVSHRRSRPAQTVRVQLTPGGLRW